MHVVLIVIGLLLALFGGGCILSLAALVAADAQAMATVLPTLLLVGGGLGILPLAAGLLVFRRGLRLDRARRNPPPSGSGGPPR